MKKTFLTLGLIFFFLFMFVHAHSSKPAALDNSSIVSIACATPTQVTVDTIFGTNAYVSWSVPAHSGLPASYIVAYKSEWDSSYT